MEATAAEAIRAFAASRYIEPARRQGARRVQITSGDVHRGLALKNRVPNVCSVLASKIFLDRNRLVIESISGPPSGMGTRVTYTYRLLEDKEVAGRPQASPDFHKLRGLLKEALHSLGGGETFLRRERERFHSQPGNNR